MLNSHFNKTLMLCVLFGLNVGHLMEVVKNRDFVEMREMAYNTTW